MKYISDEEAADQLEEFSNKYNFLGSKFISLQPYSFESEKVTKDSNCSKDEDEDDQTVPFKEQIEKNKTLE